MLKTSFYTLALFLTAQIVYGADVKKPQVSTKKTAIVPVVVPASPKKNEELTFSVNFSERYSIQAEKQDDGTRYEYLTHELNPTLATANYTFGAVFDFYDYYKTPQASSWEITTFNMNFNEGWDAGDYFTLAPTILLWAPLFRVPTDFQTAAGGRITAVLKSKNLDVPNLIFKYGLQFAKLFQKNEALLNPDGTDKIDPNTGEKQYNTSMRLRQRVHLGYKITDALTAMMYFHFDSNFWFDGTVKNAFAQETSISYGINDHVSLSTGVNNGGSLYVGDFQEKDNLKFYDKSSSEFFASLDLSF